MKIVISERSDVDKLVEALNNFGETLSSSVDIETTPQYQTVLSLYTFVEAGYTVEIRGGDRFIVVLQNTRRAIYISTVRETIDDCFGWLVKKMLRTNK